MTSNTGFLCMIVTFFSNKCIGIIMNSCEEKRSKKGAWCKGFGDGHGKIFDNNNKKTYLWDAMS